MIGKVLTRLFALFGMTLTCVACYGVPDAEYMPEWAASGRVVDPEGEPIEGIKVSMDGDVCLSNHNGRFYVEGNDDYMLQTIKNCTLLNSYRGIGASSQCELEIGECHEMMTIENVKGTCLYEGLNSYNSADVDTIKTFSPGLTWQTFLATVTALFINSVENNVVIIFNCANTWY